jgi:hypothetical protein
MLLSVLSVPEAVEAGIGTSRYLDRAPFAAGIFLWGVGILGVLIFVAAVLYSARVSPEPPK